MSVQTYFNDLKRKDKIIGTLLEYINVKPKAEYPYQDYIGVNFTDTKIISLKFYFGFYEPITKQLGNLFLDHHKEFNEFINLWTPTKNRTIKNTGFTFSLKIDDKFKVTKGFHFRFPFYKSINFPETKHFKFIPNDLINVGINFEYSNDNVLLKHYYYFDKEYNKQRFAVEYNQPFVEGASMIEYTESNNFNKIIAWDFKENIFYKHFLESISKLTIKTELDLIFNKKLCYYNRSGNGCYDNNIIKSVYYFNYKTNKKSKEFPGNRKENFQVFTIRDFLEKYLKQKLL